MSALFVLPESTTSTFKPTTRGVKIISDKYQKPENKNESTEIVVVHFMRRGWKKFSHYFVNCLQILFEHTLNPLAFCLNLSPVGWV